MDFGALNGNLPVVRWATEFSVDSVISWRHVFFKAISFDFIKSPRVRMRNTQL
jgi:hypothetical protein